MVHHSTSGRTEARTIASSQISGGSDRETYRQRAERLLQENLKFIFSSEFESDDATAHILQQQNDEPVAKRRTGTPPQGVPAHLLSLWLTPLLRPEEEQDLFRRMNYLKYQASSLRANLSPHRPSDRTMDQIERLIREAREIRDHVIQANLRLVVAIARRFVSDAVSLEELMSDGNMILMRAVDSFDYSRGFRFSTYATHAIQRECYRKYRKGGRRQIAEITMEPEMLEAAVEAPDGEEQIIARAHFAEHLRHLIDTRLEDREREILTLRLGLNSESGGKTLREVGERLGISKERVRQLQARAVSRIRAIAETHPGASTFAAS